jgi:23S rRNA (uracil1939-C5)-methyltransferase
MKLPKKQTQHKKPKTLSSLQGVYQNIEIQRLTHHGQGVAKIHQKTVFVEDALPSEWVDIKISQDLANYAQAKPMKWHRYAAERTTPFCSHYGVCGGCDLQHLSIEAQGFWKQQNLHDQLHKALDCRKLTIEPNVSEQGYGYRRRARLFLTKDAQTKQACLGFKQAQSDRVIDIEHCPILTETLNQQLKTARFDLLPLASRQLREVHLAQADNGVWLCSDLFNQSPKDEAQPYYSLQNLKLAFDPKGLFRSMNILTNNWLSRCLNG